MNKMYTSFFITLALLLYSHNIYADESHEAVVKVKSYKNIYWKYIEELWWGSATIINNKWYIITNNHVVDDGKWNVSDYFNICITYDKSKKPSCDYTATLIDRSKNLDIALLKIDSKDIFGKNVDYDSFSSLDIDYDYDVISNQDVFAVWYPGIGSETITKTKWIVSGIINYNDSEYIKSDTMIAWWNSWGALISEEGKLIWIPTFLVWSWFDNTIWYSLSIKEAKDFINQNLWINRDYHSQISNFIRNKILIDHINTRHRITDNFVDFTFDEKYEIKNYYENTWFEIVPILSNNYLVTQLRGQIFETPKITKKEDLFYFLESQGLYYKWYHKLKTVQIWGLDFFTPIVIGDAAAWEFSNYSLYFSQVGNNKLIVLLMFKSFTSDLETNKIINKNSQDLLSGIHFATQTIDDINFWFDLSSPKIKIQSSHISTINELDWEYTLYFWNLYDTLAFQLVELSTDNWKWQSIEDIYKNETLDIEPDYKSMITLKGHKWFLYCNKDYNYAVDKNDVYVKQNICVVKIYEWIKGTNDKEYILVWTLSVNKNKIKEYVDVMNFFLENAVIFEKKWEEISNLVNIYDNIVLLNFNDIKYQSDDYKNALQLLVKYNLLENSTKFDWDKAIKWKEFIKIYFQTKYRYSFTTDYKCTQWEYTCLYKNNFLLIDGEKKSFYETLEDMNIPLDEYVDVNKTQVFIDHIDLILAWVDMWIFSENWYHNYKLLWDDSIFEDIKNQRDDLNDVYNKTNIGIWELISSYEIPLYNQMNHVYYMKESWNIVTVEIYDDIKYQYSSSIFIDENQDKNICHSQASSKCYQVLTKSLMFDIVLRHINFTLFDENLRNKEWSTYNE